MLSERPLTALDNIEKSALKDEESSGQNMDRDYSQDQLLENKDEEDNLDDNENEIEEENDNENDNAIETKNEEVEDQQQIKISLEHLTNVLDNHEKEYLEQEASRKEKIRQALLDKQKVPQSYYRNSNKELLIIQYIENFDRQYTQVYPGRKQLILLRPNEFGIKKFVCSTIRPTQLPFKQTYDFRSCSSFVADYIDFIQLDPQYELPSTIFSPSYTIKMQHGNTFDCSILLASLLIGVGYDAYVVSGYAAKSITTLDQSHRPEKSLEEFLPPSYLDSQKINESKFEALPEQTKYRVKQPKELKSSFLKKQQEKLIVMKQAIELRAKDNLSKDEAAEFEDELKGLRVHSWVLILPGKREISEPFFIEPSTGTIFDCESEMYLGVESVWNTSNYWVNMQICYDGLKGISFDLSDNIRWEFVLLDNTSPSMKKNKDDQEAEEEEDEEEKKIEQAEIVDLPPSWVDKLTISKEQFESKCPNGSKTTVYKNGKIEVFAEYHRKDGMVKRIQYYSGDEIFVNLILEVFANRKDKLSHRIRKEDIIREYFLPGRSHGLKEHIMEKGVTKQMDFYSDARPDGLYRMIDEPRKNICYFFDRDDHLIYRSVTYEISKKDGIAERGALLKIAEKYDRNIAHQDYSKKTFFIKDEKIRVVFHLKEGTIIHSVREFRKPSPEQKGNTIEQVQNFMVLFRLKKVDPYLKPLKMQHLVSNLSELLRAEQILLQLIKTTEKELSDIIQVRLSEEQDLNLSFSIYDTLRNESKLASKEDGAEIYIGKDNDSSKTLEIDYLSPFLINYDNTHALSKEEKASAKDACLKSLRDRLVEKANIIQSRLEEITAEYQQRQLVYSREADTMSVDEINQYVTFCNFALFKIQILEKRLAKHREAAPERYIELDAKLRADPRLAGL